MTYVLRFLPVVEEDILAGYTCYEEKAAGLGEEFLRVILALCERNCRTETSQRVPDRCQGNGIYQP
jgi:hypothetical protein